jgi:hypothetical protein
VFELTNHNPGNKVVPVRISAIPFLSYNDRNWPWSPPKSDKKAEQNDRGHKGSLCYESTDGMIEIIPSDAKMVLTSEGLNGRIDLKPDGTKQFSILILTSGEKKTSGFTVTGKNGKKLIRQARKRWNDRIQIAYSRLGRLKTSNPDFDLFYKRGILTLLTCEWQKDEMVLNPYFSESGIDGGAFCSYLWGLGYVSRIMPLYHPQAWKEQIKLAILSDAENHYAFTPITGESIGPWYSYNQYSMIRIIYDYVMISGDVAFLTETVGNHRVIDYCTGQALYKDDPAREPELINYGTNRNLLELKKTASYQFVVPSPNAERCWSYRTVDELCQWVGAEKPDLSSRSNVIAGLITKELWSEEHKWFLTKDTLGNLHFSPSIQIFDMLRCGILSKSQEEKILTHLNETEFLSPFGIHSLSKKDPGYDLNDPDWGGPGVYAGDAPELIEDLYQSGYPEKAEDILKRILWWGKYLPYYPQAIVADQVDYRRNGRANVIAGISSTQSILFGVLGLQVSHDGKTSILVHKNRLFDTFRLEGLQVQGKNISVRSEGNHLTVSLQGGMEIQGTFGQRIYF